MKNIFRISLIGLWILLAAGFLTRWWLTSPAAQALPNFPESFWVRLIVSSGAQKGDVAILVGFFMSLIIVSLLTLLGLFLWRRIQNALTSRSSGRAKARR